jgi:NAD(P)H dehydrogenase (quinone)
MIAVTGATGHLGPLAIQALVSRGVRPGEIVAMARRPAKASNLADRDVHVRRADYDAPDTLVAALAGVDRLLLISGNEVGRRVAQHRNMVDAARTAGVRLVAYTSVVKADTTRLLLAAEHKATEEMIRASGVPFVFLRNSWYIENYTRQLAQTLDRGVFFGCADGGRVSAATRADYAEAGAAVMAGDGHENRVYELGGDEAFTMNEFAAEISRQSGRAVEYRDMPFEAYLATLVGAGLPEPVARAYADSDLGIARGELFVDSYDLSRLIGRPTTSLSRTVEAALTSLRREAGAARAEAGRRGAESSSEAAPPS